MKRLTSLAAVLFLTFSTGFGQVDIKLWDSNSQSGIGNNLNGEEHIYAVSTDSLYYVILNFKNTSGITKTWKMERYRITDAVLWEDYFSWEIPGDPFGYCYSSNQMNTNPWMTPDMNTLTVASGESVNLAAYTVTEGTGTEWYRFYLIEGQSTRVDSVDVRIVTSALGIADPPREEVSVSVYPNPVSSNLVIAANGVGGAFDVKVTDVLGKVVLNESFGQAKKVLDVSEYKNGVYLVSVFSKGELIRTRRVVIKH